MDGLTRRLSDRLSDVSLNNLKCDGESGRKNLLAVSLACDTRDSFRGKLPTSLHETHDSRDCVAPIFLEEINLGRKLGSGEFSNAYEIESFSLKDDLESGTKTEDELKKRFLMQRGEKYRKTGQCRYALKHLKREYFEEHDSDMYVQAACDLTLEAEFLASLNHPHIMKLRGLPFNGTDGFENGPGGYFLIIDRLVETLGDRIQSWAKSGFSGKRRLSIFGGGGLKEIRRRSLELLPIKRISKKDLTKSASLPNPTKTKVDEQLDERLSVALQIASAIKYLHSHNIIFRDMKPANIGFDVRNDVKLFDFGLARVMPSHGCPYTDVFDMSGAGSPRYMSPECLRGFPNPRQRYNLKADIYSFAIILWEMLTATQPYAFVKSREQLIEHVVHKNARPHIKEQWPQGIKIMLETSFDKDVEMRPKASLFYEMIKDNLKVLRNGDGRHLNDTWVLRRRSENSKLSISCPNLKANAEKVRTIDLEETAKSQLADDEYSD